MKAINIQSSYPGFSDGLIVYQGETPLNSSSTQVRQYRVDTEIRTSLFSCAFTTRGSVVFQIPTLISTSTSGTKTVTFQVPAGCIVNYYISGSVFKVADTTDLIDEGLQSEWSHYYYMHQHNGISGIQTYLSNIEPDGQPYMANKRVAVSSDGGSFIYVDASQGANPPVFTIPALNTPTDAVALSVDEAGATVFSWDAATNMISSDSYTVLFQGLINPENGFAIPLAGDILSHTGIDFTGMENEVFAWWVIATNADGTSQTEQRTLFIT